MFFLERVSSSSYSFALQPSKRCILSFLPAGWEVRKARFQQYHCPALAVRIGRSPRFGRSITETGPCFLLTNVLSLLCGRDAEARIQYSAARSSLLISAWVTLKKETETHSYAEWLIHRSFFFSYLVQPRVRTTRWNFWYELAQSI